MRRLVTTSRPSSSEEGALTKGKVALAKRSGRRLWGEGTRPSAKMLKVHRRADARAYFVGTGTLVPDGRLPLLPSFPPRALPHLLGRLGFAVSWRSFQGPFLDGSSPEQQAKLVEGAWTRKLITLYCIHESYLAQVGGGWPHPRATRQLPSSY